MKRLLLIPALLAGLLLPPKAEAQITPQGAAFFAVLGTSAVVTGWLGYKAGMAAIGMGNSGNQTFVGYIPNGHAPDGGVCPDGNYGNALADFAVALWFDNCHAILAFHTGQCSPPPSIGSETDNSICMSPDIQQGLGDAGCARATSYSNALSPGHSTCGP